ncbi:MAG TPA: hypothetical protein VFV23_14540 [Verrucomicrobiae bacterium]|nr:hypothetical protein [Verrucomicrobiae bacterium]
MLLLPRLVWFCLCFGLLFSVLTASAQTNYYSANGSQYPVVGALAGDQVYPDAAINSTNGYVVWQDNATDGSGLGISARRLDGTLSGTLSIFRVNVAGTNDQENPHVELLKGGGAVFVWQGGKAGLDQHIYARFLSSSNTWLTDDVLVNTLNTNGANLQIDPAVAVLANGNVAVTWSSFNQVASNSLQDVYAQVLSSSGAKVGTNFLVNQFTSYNQRTPSITALKSGGFVVTWVSEGERSTLSAFDQTNGAYTTQITLPSVDVYARLYNSNGVATAGEFLASTDSLIHANPSVAAGSDGGFMIAWSGNNTADLTNSWDVYARQFSGTGVGGRTIEVNSRTYGDEYIPKISSIGTDYMIVWTSLGQDGDREGIFGQLVHGDGSLVGSEFRVNSTTLGQQMCPAVASDGGSEFLAVWTSFTFSGTGFDLYAQRYANVDALLEPMSAPYVYAPFTLSNNVYQPQLQVTWAPLQGISVASYEVYVDGSASPTGIVTSNMWIMTAANGLTTNSTHSFIVDYVTTDGRHSPMSPSTSGTTWSGLSWYGIPYEWMAMYFGGYYSGAYHTNFWPSPDTAVAPGGPTILQVFQTGGDPFDPGTWLVVSLNKTAQGMFVNWNTQPGLTYQLQTTTNLTAWSNVGSPRFAAGATDSVNVGSGGNSYYRVILVR